MNDARAVYLAHLPHPGGEHKANTASWFPWNTHPFHRRKFLRSHGKYVGVSDALADADMVFWGEWEPPSIVVDRWPAEGRLPRYLHEPVWVRPQFEGLRQNTDPWIFGEEFKYSNCKQLTYKRNRSQMQRLTRGSVVLFGSALDGDFVLDTVFVVSESVPFSPGSTEAIDIDEAFRVCTVESLLTTGHPDEEFMLYRGATHDEPVDGMYSFVPCRRADDPHRRFLRPALSLPGYLNPASWQAASGASRALDSHVVREQWSIVRDTVLSQHCLLGVSFVTPPLHDGGTDPVP